MERPDPDELLERVKAEENERGRLKIFFGAVAGVGKTYSMLEAARQRKKEGIDVVVGYVETHKRPETTALLEGLEVLPPAQLHYKNVSLREFDIDAALKRDPQLILVDELAHTNAPGSRHLKRWQDVEELLDKGIDVFTTLNVQHVESANDIVSEITGVTVRETVPDTFVEQAEEIELVDLPVEELLKRLKEGKVYLGDQAQRAVEHFFQPGNLIALRQLALRYTAHNVEEKLLTYKQTHAISKVWKVRDRFLICISPSPNSISLIRAGKRIAADLGVEWTVAYVETLTGMPSEKGRIAELMRFAEDLGARVATLNGTDIAQTLITYARSKNITKIIVGKPGRPGIKELLFGSVIDKLARASGEIDLFLLSSKEGEEVKHIAAEKEEKVFPLRKLFATLGIVTATTAVNRILFPYVALVNLIMVYFLGVAWIAYRYGKSMSVLAAFLSVLVFDFFFTPPYLTFVVDDIQYVFTFAVMLIAGLLIANLTGQLRRQNIAMQQRQGRTQVLYELNRDLAKSSHPDELFGILRGHVEEYFKCEAVIFTPDRHNKLSSRFGEDKGCLLDEHELAVAQWVFEYGKPAGKGTETLPAAKGLYMPLVGTEKAIGVLGVSSFEEEQFSGPEQFHMLEMFSHQAASAIEGAQLAASAIDARARVANEHFRNLLLTTFTYELPVPLEKIGSLAKDLLRPENVDDPEKRRELIDKLRRETERLNQLLAELPKIISGETP
jgi:two-component system, OmpR family, sensor histidine kinase KdpD